MKEKQIYDHELFSEDLLIRSQRESMATIIPYLLEPNAFTAAHGFRLNPLQSVETSSMLRLNPRQRIYSKAIMQDDAAEEEDQAKEERLEEHIRQQQLRARRDQKQHGKELALATTSDAAIFVQKAGDADANMDSDEIDMDDLIQCMEDASIEEIEDEVSPAAVRKHRH